MEEAALTSNRSTSGERENNDNIHEDDRNQNTTRAALDELIQEDARLKESIEAAHESKRKWRKRNSAIDRRNSKLELDVKMLRDEIDQLQSEIIAKSEESKTSRDDLETYKSRNRREAADFWARFQEEAQKYSNLFTSSLVEYSTNCLKEEIEGYRRQSDIVRGIIGDVEKDMEALKAQYGLAELGTNEQANLLADIHTAKRTISDNNLLLRTTKSFEDNIEVLKLKVKQKKDDIAYLQNNKSCKK